MRPCPLWTVTMQLPLFGPPCTAIIDLLSDGVLQRGMVCGDTMVLYGAGGLWDCEPEWADEWRCPTCGASQELGREFARLPRPVLFALAED